MSTAPLPINEFAKRLRSKYPGAYDSLSDSQLVQKVVDKYPDYKQHIASFAPTQMEQQQPERSVTDAYDPKAEGATSRFLGSAGAALLSVPGAIARTVADPTTATRDLVSTVGNAIKTYADPKTRPTWEGIKSVLPEALGTGFGNVAAGYVPEAAKGAKELAGTALRDPYNEVRAPIKAVAAAGKILGAPELSEAFIPNRPGAYSAAERAAVPLNQSPNYNSAAFRAGRASINPPEPEPELGSPENPGFMSKLPSRLPPKLRGDPLTPPEPVDAPEATRQIEAATEPNPANVAVVPEPRAPLPSDRPGSAWSLTRTKGLPEAALRGQPGAADVLRQVGQPVVMTPRSGGFDSPNMQALRESLGITESVPQGNPTPYSPPAPAPEATDSAFAPWFKPRRTPVLQ